MNTADIDDRSALSAEELQSVRCSACDAALQSPGRDTISFLLFDQFTVPLVGCPDHLEEFSGVCGLTTEADATLLEHRPAGVVRCVGCQHAVHRTQYPVVPVGTGAVAVLACGTHQADIVDGAGSDRNDRILGPVYGVLAPHTPDATGRSVLQQRGVGLRRQPTDAAELL